MVKVRVKLGLAGRGFSDKAKVSQVSESLYNVGCE